MTTNKIELLRFGGYVGVSLNGLLVPLLVFQLTHSASLAGLSLLIEWLPKMGFYLFGGALSKQLSGQRAHRRLELFRLGALASLAGAAAGWLPWQAIALAAAVYQCTNAVSNILFEVLVTQHWSDRLQAAGHAHMMRADLAAGVLATGLGILTGNTVFLLMLGLGMQGLVAFGVWRWSGALYPVGTTPAPLDWRGLIQTTGTAVRAVPGALWRLSFLSFAMGLPVALIYSALPFVFEHAFPGLEVTPRQLSLFLLFKSLTSLGVAQLAKRGLSRFPHSEHRWAGVGAALMGVGLALCLTADGLVLVVGVILAGWAGYFYSPWARTRRQAGMPTDALRLPMTGVLISVEAACYLAGAGLLALAPGGIAGSLLLSVLPLGVAALVFFAWPARGKVSA